MPTSDNDWYYRMLLEALRDRAHAVKSMRRCKSVDSPQWSCMWRAQYAAGNDAAIYIDRLGGLASAW